MLKSRKGLCFAGKISATAVCCLLWITNAGAWPTEFLRTVDKEVPAKDYLEAWGLNPAFQRSNYSRNDVLQVYLVDCDAPATILWPGDKPEFTFQFSNLTGKPVKAEGKVHVIQYGIYTLPGTNVFDIGIRKIKDIGSTPISVSLPADGWQNVKITPDIPERFGGYALIIELNGQARLFGATCIRCFKPEIARQRFHKLTMDMGYVPALLRLGVTVNRMGIGYKPTTDGDFEVWYKEQCKYLDELKQAGLPVAIEFGAGHPRNQSQPLGQQRPWLDDKGVMLDTKSDMAWLPSYDPDFRKFVARFLTDYGWPKGPVNAVKLWNEPWNGISISGWGADDYRYREIYTAMAQGVEDAEREAGVDVWTGGCDSSSNTMDKLFSGGSDEYLKWLDFMSIHYQGTNPCTTIKMFNGRKVDGKPAPVEVWDTESWVANSDDRIAGVLAAMYSFGQKRVVGVNSDCMVTAYQDRRVKTDAGIENKVVLQTWSAGAAVSAFQHFVGERDFKELMFRPGLPFAMLFEGENGAVEDSSIVVIGDMGTIFGVDNVVLNNARSLAEVRRKKDILKKLLALPEGSAERVEQEKLFAAKSPYEGASLTINANGEKYSMYDFYGNRVEPIGGKIVIPLDARGFYLRGNGRAGSFDALVKAVKTSRIDGIEPLNKVCRDMLKPIDQNPSVKLVLTNVLNRPVSGKLEVTLGDLKIDYPAAVAFKPNETKTVEVKVVSGKASSSNQYPLTMTFDAGADGMSVHYEKMRVNYIRRQTVAIDGRLDEWKNAIPQQISIEGVQEATLTEKAWLPFQTFDESFKKGFAVGYLAYDDNYFYFAAKIADSTPDPGTIRFETRDEDAFFYPETSYSKTAAAAAENLSIRWRGFIRAPATGKYNFITNSDDGIRVNVAGKRLIDNWTGHGATDDSGSIELEAGNLYPITVEYFQGGGDCNLLLDWEEPGKSRTRIPAEVFFQKEDGGQRGLVTQIYAGTNMDRLVQTRVDANIDYNTFSGDIGSANFARRSEGELTEHRWPDGVRRYSYRREPILPTGNAPNFDNVQLAFNVLDPDKKWMSQCPPGTYPGYVGYVCSDYEYALNQVAPAYGGGTEIWRLRKPGHPEKHFYPHSPKFKGDGAVKEGSLLVLRDDKTRYVECAIPWSEIPDVKKRMDAGQNIKFSFRVNDNAGIGCMELSKGRSVARRNCSFMASWIEHWANELEFGFEK